MKRLAASALALVAAAFAHEGEHEARDLTFPSTATGLLVLPVDLHTHSVFSDGHVWPTVRTWEAAKDGLAAIAVTEHLEYQPHRDDIPHPDRNRSYELTREAAERTNAREGSNLLVIPGAEITRRFEPGHVNAVFIKDANPLLTIDRRDEDNLENAREAFEEARRQGAFVFWNHPAWPRDFRTGVLELTRRQRQLFRDGLIQGIEVANGQYYSEEAFDIAMKEDLVILGTSDIHGLIDYDYDIEGGEHRTVTLVLAREHGLDAIEQGLKTGRTVALYRGQMIGLEENVVPVIEGALSIEPLGVRRNSEIMGIRITNEAPVDITIRNVGPKRFNNQSDVVTIPAHGHVDVALNDTRNEIGLTLPVEILTAFTAPGQHPRLTLR